MAVVLAALVGANLFLWLDQPAPPQPATDARASNAPRDATPHAAAPAPGSSVQTSTEPAPEPDVASTATADDRTAPQPSSKPSDQPPEKALDLTLDPMALADANFQDPAKNVPPIAAPLELSSNEPAPGHKWLADDLTLFTHDVRSFSRGQWISESLRLRGGIGYYMDDQTRERQFAFGLGIGLAF